jgi:hypothetical protein
VAIEVDPGELDRKGGLFEKGRRRGKRRGGFCEEKGKDFWQRSSELGS